MRLSRLTASEQKTDNRAVLIVGSIHDDALLAHESFTMERFPSPLVLSLSTRSALAGQVSSPATLQCRMQSTVHMYRRIQHYTSEVLHFACTVFSQLSRCSADRTLRVLQAATCVVASVIHSRYIGLDMTRKLSVPRHAHLEQQIWCDSGEAATAAVDSHAAHGCTSSAQSNHSQVSSQVHAVEAEAGPQNTAQSAPQHASGRGSAETCPGRVEQQDDVPCGQTGHHVSFQQTPERLVTPMRKRPASAHRNSGSDNPFQQFTFGQAGKQAIPLEN